jgi:hypothetical protein
VSGGIWREVFSDRTGRVFGMMFGPVYTKSELKVSMQISSKWHIFQEHFGIEIQIVSVL